MTTIDQYRQVETNLDKFRPIKTYLEQFQTSLDKILPAFRVRGHVERRSFHTDPGAIVLYWHVAPQELGPFVQECKTPKCVESLDSHRDVSTGRKPEN